jgi:hypothetical protein
MGIRELVEEFLCKKTTFDDGQNISRKSLFGFQEILLIHSSGIWTTLNKLARPRFAAGKTPFVNRQNMSLRKCSPDPSSTTDIIPPALGLSWTKLMGHEGNPF